MAVADLIRRRCTVANGWLAEWLKMRGAANVSQQLRRAGGQTPKLSKPLREFIARTDS